MSGSNARAERRRLDRQARKRTDVVMVGDGLVARSLREQYRATGGATLPDKIRGKHRWVASATYVLDDHAAATAYDDQARNLLGPGKLMYLAAWCMDCERPLSGGVDGIPGADWDSECTGVGAVTGEITDEGTLEP